MSYKFKHSENYKGIDISYNTEADLVVVKNYIEDLGEHAENVNHIFCIEEWFFYTLNKNPDFYIFEYSNQAFATNSIDNAINELLKVKEDY